MKQFPFISMFILLLPLADIPAKVISRNEILAAGPEWQEEYDTFQPDPKSIEALKSILGKDLTIHVYLGLWCPDSRKNVPPFLKILDELQTSIPVQFFSVGRKPSQKIRYYFEKARVERVPTFIFIRGDTEIGRIVEYPKRGFIEDMTDILSK